MPFLPPLRLHGYRVVPRIFAFRRRIFQIRLPRETWETVIDLDEAVKLIIAYDLGVDRWR